MQFHLYNLDILSKIKSTVQFSCKKEEREQPPEAAVSTSGS